MTERRSPYHITEPMETAIIERMARLMYEEAERSYPYGMVNKSDQYRHLLTHCLPELRIWATRNTNLDRETEQAQ